MHPPVSGLFAIDELQPHELGVDTALGNEAIGGAALRDDALVNDGCFAYLAEGREADGNSPDSVSNTIQI